MASGVEALTGRSRARIGAAVLAVPLLAALWGFWIEPASLRDEAYRLSVAGWPSACDGLRIAVLADLHVGSPHNGLPKLERVVDLTLAAEPDLILLAGDYVIHGVAGGRFVPPESAARVLARLRAPGGVYAVLGNHDWWLDGPRVSTALEGVSIRVLEDRAVRVSSGRCELWLAGIGDYTEALHDVERALSDVPPDAPVVAFTHDPDVFPEIPARVRLTIAGHTHGGQVRLPGIGRPIVPSRYGERYAAGHVVEGGRHLFVSTGLGTSILPVRFGVPPEISLLDVGAEPTDRAP